MTLSRSRYDKFALLPKRCDKCRRTFIFEGYDVHYSMTSPVFGCGIELVICKECLCSEWKAVTSGEVK
jgi:hypothetical protein